MSVQFYCERCGGLFNTKSTLRRFCDGCRAAKWTEYNSEYQRRKRAASAKRDGRLERINARIEEVKALLERLEARAEFIKQTPRAAKTDIEGRQG